MMLVTSQDETIVSKTQTEGEMPAGSDNEFSVALSNGIME